MGRIKELDGLRALAVLSVLTAHFVPPSCRLSNVLRLGWCGVDLFFAISGFLITGILIGLRHKEGAFQTFYWRRTLRIFPPYYLALGLILGLALAHAERLNYREIVGHALFLSSAKPGLMKLAVRRLSFAMPAAPVGALQHAEYSLLQFKDCLGIYWSLSVEELFYLVWAPIVLKGSRRIILLCSIAPLLGCPLLRGLAHTTPHIEESIGFIFRFDSLAAGGCVALLCWGLEHGRMTRKALDRGLISAAILFPISLIALAAICGVSRGVDVRTTWAFSVFGFSLLAASCASFVGALARWGAGLGRVSHVLRSKGAVHLGKVSYTIYLIHLPAYVVVQLMIIRWFGPDAIALSLKLAILAGGLATVAAILFASFSWHYIEAPILRWKDKWFPVRSTARPLSVESVADRSDPICA
ncbi:MAG: acyltransferase family protein [Candidatus Sulfotelmatobacter sp.]